TCPPEPPLSTEYFYATSTGSLSLGNSSELGLDPVERPDPLGLYNSLCSIAVLAEGWARVFANAGGPGGDHVTIHDFALRSEIELERLALDLTHETYRPGPVRHTHIPKRTGGTRPLAIPCVRDRVAQSAFHALIEPILEPSFEDSSFGYRPGRGVADAIGR